MDEIERWHHGGRYYDAHLVSTPDTFDLELDDLGPVPDRGLILVASRDDETGEITFCALHRGPPSHGAVEQFVADARRRLPPMSSHD